MIRAKSAIRVLFVDDDENLVASHRRNFQRLYPDWQGIFLTDPRAALDMLLSDSSISATILDIHMPALTGLQMAAQLHQHRPDLIIIMLTGYADLQSMLQAVNEYGVHRFYPKPTPMNVLMEGVADALDKRRMDDCQIPDIVLDLFNLGLISTNERLEIVHMNAQAADMDLFFHPLTGRVAPMHKSFSLAHDDRTLSVFLRRIPPRPSVVGSTGASGFVFVLIEPDTIAPPRINDLMDVFGLTRSEAKLTQKLAEGLSLDQASNLVGISVQSARTYLKAIFTKTGANRQPQLMKIVLSGIPALRG
ncbi:response regulator [Thalassospira sp.]|uniref:DNA-binding response regulator n=1 Tax=Thalassospira sp. TaxID=1912094 RepID=UPI0027363072|nr:response regulator [Thalassospira sp.]MDP2699160.1 response regulator [Thalassospira sp.]